MIKFILIGLAAVIVVFVIVVTTRPADFRIARSATFAASAPIVFEQINDLHKFNDWSPWAKIDPNAKATFDGPPAGVGSSFAWSGNSEVGEGRMTITESKPGEVVRMKLEFIKPFAATNTAEFTLKPEGNQTTLTWSMTGKNGFMAKAFSMFVDCDKMVGSQFEQGLANLKAIVEKPSAS
jgi:hypothetical protein